MLHEELDPINRSAGSLRSSPFSSTLELMISLLRMDVEMQYGQGLRSAQCREAAALVAERTVKFDAADVMAVPVMSIKRVRWHNPRRASAVRVSQLRSMRPQVPGVAA